MEGEIALFSRKKFYNDDENISLKSKYKNQTKYLTFCNNLLFHDHCLLSIFQLEKSFTRIKVLLVTIQFNYLYCEILFCLLKINEIPYYIPDSYQAN